MTSVASSEQVTLSEADRSRLYMFVHSGQQSARARTRAQVLQKLGEGWSLPEICRAFDVCRNTVLRGCFATEHHDVTACGLLHYTLLSAWHKFA